MDLVPVGQGPDSTRCKVCSDPRREAIEARLMTPGASVRAVAAEFNIPPTTLSRHQPHLSQVIEAARASKEIEGLSALYKRIKSRGEKLSEIATAALAAGNFRDAVAALTAAAKQDELLAKLGEKPGFRTAGPSNTINAPDARIVITRDGGPR
jgi:hypothetical protein